MIVRSRQLKIFMVLGLVCLLCAGGEVAHAQSATLTKEENFRAAQNGLLLGQLRAGLSVEVVELTDDWVQFDLEGWVYTPSLRTNSGRFGLAVSVEGGENIRGAPNGEILGRLDQGTVLENLESVSGWNRVRRRAWVWRGSVVLFGSDTSGGSADRSRLTVPTTAADDEEWTLGGTVDAPILSAPGGDTLAFSAPGTNLRVLAREGNWARIRLEGWVWLPQVEDGDRDVAVRTDVTIESIMAEPDEYRGAVLQWDLQFISLERAEAIRSDFYETEPFLLTRIGEGEEGFVYVAIPPERLAEAQGLSPLERIRVVGRVRTGAARPTGNPILELLSLVRIP